MKNSFIVETKLGVRRLVNFFILVENVLALKKGLFKEGLIVVSVRTYS
ncbi:MAG: hypothetical protein ACFFBX_11190 [Promethearchaeota archaeon]